VQQISAETTNVSCDREREKVIVVRNSCSCGSTNLFEVAGQLLHGDISHTVRATVGP
jgi:hypothetical protein